MHLILNIQYIYIYVYISTYIHICLYSICIYMYTCICMDFLSGYHVCLTVHTECPVLDRQRNQILNGASCGCLCGLLKKKKKNGMCNSPNNLQWYGLKARTNLPGQIWFELKCLLHHEAENRQRKAPTGQLRYYSRGNRYFY